MFLDNWIPVAHAQFTQQVKSTAVAGEEVAVSGAQTGLQELLKFVASNIDNWIAGIIIVIISWVIAKMAASAIKREILKKKGDMPDEDLFSQMKEEFEDLGYKDFNDLLLKLEVSGKVRVSSMSRGKRRIELVQ